MIDQTTDVEINSLPVDGTVSIYESTKRVEDSMKLDDMLQSRMDMSQAVQTRAQKLQEGKKFKSLKVMNSPDVDKDVFRSEQMGRSC